MKYFDPDSYAQALSAVQKILAIVSGTLVPSGEKIYRDKKGHERSIEPDQYLNRIFSYIEQNSGNDPVITVVESEMAYIFAKAEHSRDKNKVLHERVSKEDVELAIIHMYLVIAEIAKIRKIETIYLKTPPSGKLRCSAEIIPSRALNDLAFNKSLFIAVLIKASTLE